MRACSGWLALWVAAAVLTGCGDADLWARYGAERDLWHARRAMQRVELDPRLADADDYARVEALLRRVVDRYPAARWAAPGRVGAPLARDVASVSGRAAIALGHLEEIQGRPEAAFASFARAQSEYAAVPAVALEAALEHAAALDRAGLAPAATARYAEIARDFAMVDPASGEPILAVMDAPIRVARDQETSGNPHGADSTLRAAEGVYMTELERQRGRPAAPALWQRLAQARMATGRLVLALEALRGGLAEPRVGSLKPAIVLTMGEYCVEGGLTDSALAYAAWARGGFGPDTRARAMVLEAEAWEGKGPADSALAAWGRFLDSYPSVVGRSSLARYRRGRIFEQQERWDEARGEYRSLVATDPTHELAFDAVRRLVDHHASRGEKELARLEGQQAVEALDRTIATNRDRKVLHLARATRADILLAIEDWTPACAALADLWERYGDSAAGVKAGFQAAEIAEVRLHDSARALQLYRDLANRVWTDADRRKAQVELMRIERSRS